MIDVTGPWPTDLLTALRRGQLLVAEVTPSRPARRAWIAIYPQLTLDDRVTTFNLFHREFDRTYIDNNWCIGPDDGMIEVRTTHARDEAELTATLAAWNIRPRDLTYVHRSDYPV